MGEINTDKKKKQKGNKEAILRMRKGTQRNIVKKLNFIRQYEFHKF